MPVPALPITRNLKRKSEQMVPRIKDTHRERKTQGIKGKIESQGEKKNTKAETAIHNKQ